MRRAIAFLPVLGSALGWSLGWGVEIPSARAASAAPAVSRDIAPQAPAAGQPAATQAGAPAATALDQALALVPPGAIAFVILPAPKHASDDLQQCLERMNRPEVAIAGRPIDQAKAYYGISGSFDDKGPVALSVFHPRTEGTPPPMVLSLPATDPRAFIEANLAKAPEFGPDGYRMSNGTAVHAKAGARHVHLSTDADALAAFDPGAGIGAALRTRLGERGAALLAKGDLVAWAGRDAIQPAVRRAADQASRQMPVDSPFSAQMNEFRQAATRLLDGVEDGLVVVDLDPLGLGVRTFARFADGSEIAGLAAGGKDREARFDRLPRQPFYAAGRVDVDGLGGAAALQAILAKLPGAPALPDWLVRTKDAVRAIQMAIYPSKLALAAGGLLNDSALYLETETPDTVRDGIRDAILAMKGEERGLRRDPTWQPDKTLKSGEVADAYEVAETVVASNDANPADLSMSRLIAQGIYGSRGLVGFVRRMQGGVMMTFSQRADVLERATKTASGAPSLAADPVIGAYREWLIDRPELGRADVELYIGVGQFGKLFQQVLTMVPGGDKAPVPQIPTSVEPIALALEVDKGTIETAAVLPSGVLGLMADGLKAQFMGAPPSAPAAPATPATPATKETR